MIGATSYTTKTQIAQQGQLSSDIATLQSQISTGKRLTSASDDPSAAARIAAIRTTQANNAVYAKNADTGTAIASTVDTQLSTIASALDRANEILITGRSDTSSASDRTNLASELRGIAQDIQSYASSTDPNGNPLFPTSPTAIPISDTLSITATASQASVFNVTDSSGTTMSMSDYLNAAADRLANAGSNAAATSDDITTLGTVIANVSSVRTGQGIREQRFNDAKDRLANTDVDLKTERSGLEDTDLTYAVSELQMKQTALQAAQTTYATSHKSTLFDLLG